MKGGKAPGKDDISIDLLKVGGEQLNDRIATLLTNCLDANRISIEWTDANVILLFKKGEKEELRNYRPISLLSALYKVFTKIITNRIMDQLDSNQPAEQAGFRLSLIHI